MSRVTYGNGTFVAVGNLGKAVYSRGGLTWSNDEVATLRDVLP